MFKKITLVTCLLALSQVALIQSAVAGPAADEAQKHFAAIGMGDVDPLMAEYAPDASLNWIGGSLDGTYVGTQNIRAVWEKFTKAQGMLKVSVEKLEESSNPKGSTVTANVKFEGKQAIKVRYVIVSRDGHIVSETWQIDPALTLGTAY
ncbi:MAG TPA: nuclear transport factor 2 family protein [Rhodocyclaceae bacterium]|nr:nuclear transport factor 2 family protein [Rhodocyclaceae bacterium]